MPQVPMDLSDESYREAVVDLLGVLAYGELEAFSRLAADSTNAPDFYHRIATARMAAAEFGHFQLLRDRIIDLGADPDVAMEPFVAAIDGFHASTAPADWLEGLVKIYVGDGIAMDFYRAVANYVDPQTRALVIEVCDDLGHSAFVIESISEAIAADPKVAGRLALWGRRLMGEAVAQSQRVAIQREGLVELVLGGMGPDLDAMSKMFSDLTDAHSARMRTLGLEP
ncbi:MAG: ferritin-like fold-containing protein [Actinomycetes bacterium]